MGRVILNRSVNPPTTAPPMFAGWGPAIALDLAAVLIFVGVGRISHDESLAPGGLWATAWPFLVGLVGGYIGVLLTRWPAQSVRAGAVVAVKTVILGLVIRFGIQQDDVPLAFVVVTFVVIGALTLGWRLAGDRIAARA